MVRLHSALLVALLSFSIFGVAEALGPVDFKAPNNVELKAEVKNGLLTITKKEGGTYLEIDSSGAITTTFKPGSTESLGQMIGIVTHDSDVPRGSTFQGMVNLMKSPRPFKTADGTTKNIHLGYHFLVDNCGSGNCKVVQVVKLEDSKAGATPDRRINHVSAPAERDKRSPRKPGFRLELHNGSTYAIGVFNNADLGAPQAGALETATVVALALQKLYDIPGGNLYGHSELQCHQSKQGEGEVLRKKITGFLGASPSLSSYNCRDMPVGGVGAGPTQTAPASTPTQDAEKLKAELAKWDVNSDLPSPISDQLKKYGFSDSEVEDVAKRLKENPDKTTQLLEALAQGDEGKVKEAAKDLGLSQERLDELASQAKKLDLPVHQTDATTPTNDDGTPRFASTFAGIANRLPEAQRQVLADLEKKYGLPEGYLATTFLRESGGNCSAQNRVSSAFGCFQFLNKTWDMITGGLPRELRADFAVSAEAAAKLASQAYSRVGNLIQQSGIDPVVGLYATHLMGEQGARNFLTQLINNPGAPISSALGWGAIQSNAKLFMNGGQQRTVAEAAQQLGVFLGGASGIVPATGGYVPSYASSPFGFVGSGVTGGGAFGGIFGGYNYTGGATTGYPTTVGVPTTVGTPTSVGTPTTVGTPTVGGTPTTIGTGGVQINPVTGQPIVPTTGTQTGTNTGVITPVSPVLTIIPQAKSIPRGRSVIISWSSVGVANEYTCIVTTQGVLGSSQVGSGREGSKTIPTTSQTPQGIAEFNFLCSGNDGTKQLRQTTSVTVN